MQSERISQQCHECGRDDLIRRKLAGVVLCGICATREWWLRAKRIG